MGFMQAVWEHGVWLKAETDMGTVIVPANVLTIEDLRREYGQRVEFETVEGWGARLSAPGYMDCTEWTLHESAEEAKAYLVDTYELCERCGDDSPENTVCDVCRHAADEEGVEETTGQERVS